MPDLVRLFTEWRKRVIGTHIRSQQVEECSLMLEVFSDGPKVGLKIYFRPKPYDDLEDYVFCEIPGEAETPAMPLDEAIEVLEGAREPQWYCEDELPNRWDSDLFELG